MFTWKVKDERKLTPYFRVIYALQLAAALVMIGGFFLVWWQSADSLNGFDLLEKSVTRLRERNVSGVIQPLLSLWLLWPLILIGGARGLIGIVVSPVALRWAALAAWFFALGALAHFWIAFHGDLPDHSPLDLGRIRPGYWITEAAALLLGVLLIVESRIKLEEPAWASQGIVRGGPVTDAERLWKGDYQTCPHCGMLNEPGARTCYNCQNLLFSFDQKP